MLKIKQLHLDAKIPTRAHPTDSGLDLYAYLPDGNIVLPKIDICGYSSILIPTGIAIGLPQALTIVTESDGTKYTLIKEAQFKLFFFNV